MTDEEQEQPSAGPDAETVAQASTLLDAYLKETEGLVNVWTIEARDLEAGRAILEGTETLLVAVARDGFARRTSWRHGEGIVRSQHQKHALDVLLGAVLQYPLSLREEDVLYLLERVDCRDRSHDPDLLFGALFRAVLWQMVQYAEDYGLPPGSVSWLTHLREKLGEKEWPDMKRLMAWLDELLGGDKRPLLVNGKPWGAAAIHALAAMAAEERVGWERLLRHAYTTELVAPSWLWRKRAKDRLAEVGKEAFEKRVREWLALVEASSHAPLLDRNSSVLRGLVWMCGLLGNPGMAGALADMAMVGYKKLPKSPVLSAKLGNAAIYALSLLPGAEAVAQLGRLRSRLKHPGAQEAIQKALKTAASCAGLPVNEIEELLVPSFGMEEPGLLQETWGDYRISVAFIGASGAEWSWQGADGKPQKPAQVKKAHPEEWKALKETAGDIQKLMTAQRDRIERLLLVEREWEIATWRTLYLDHPLLAVMTRRLIWEFQTDGRTETGIWKEGSIEDVTGRTLEGLTEKTRVRLWHPIRHQPQVVLDWRVRLEEQGIVQPFKQAHREVYLLTDAERRTGNYSNRFAAHILKHYQFHALCQGRGWRYTLPRFNDSQTTPTVELPHWGLRAEFWVQAQEHTDFSDTAVAIYLATDQVRFYGRNNRPVSLSEVPALAFSEVMRDVDLFIGVCSVGNDPAWRDGIQDRTRRDYWESYSFGNLSASALTRRDLLERLLPRLRIASRCTLAGRFLVVRGDIRTYKIHLGSGNILMTPNDQYLCIVPDQSTLKTESEQGVFLPFEGDRTLSLILSKAFLLADDTKITDQTIVSQIRPFWARGTMIESSNG